MLIRQLSRRFRLVNMDRVPKVLCVLVRMSDMRQVKGNLCLWSMGNNIASSQAARARRVGHVATKPSRTFSSEKENYWLVVCVALPNDVFRERLQTMQTRVEEHKFSDEDLRLNLAS